MINLVASFLMERLSSFPVNEFIYGGEDAMSCSFKASIFPSLAGIIWVALIIPCRNFTKTSRSSMISLLNLEIQAFTGLLCMNVYYAECL